MNNPDTSTKELRAEIRQILEAQGVRHVSDDKQTYTDFQKTTNKLYTLFSQALQSAKKEAFHKGCAQQHAYDLDDMESAKKDCEMVARNELRAEIRNNLGLDGKSNG